MGSAASPQGRLELGARCLAAAALLAASPAADAAPPPEAAACEAAAAAAAQETGVPLGLLRAVMLAETGRRAGDAWHPWPWAVNVAGRGTWHPDRGSAVRAVESALAEGASVDVGCFQLNVRWHGRHFPGIEAMIAPATNARHAARFLLALRDELGTWPAAAGAYHSRDAARSAAYAARVLAHWRPADEPAAGPPAATVRAGFPLLDPARPARGPSLFPTGARDAGPLVQAARPLIGGG